MTKRQKKHIFTVLRIIICVVFVALAVQGLSIHDKVTLKADSSNGERVCRLAGEDDATVTILTQDGEEQVVPRENVAVDSEGSERIERGLGTAFKSSNPVYLFLAIALFAPVPLIQSLRFQLMLRAQEIELTYWESVKITMGGNFLNFVFLIGSTAGDVFKAYCTTLHTERKTEAVTTILFDRVVGLSGLLVVAGLMSFTGSADPMLRKLGVFALVMLGIFLLGAWMITAPKLSELVLQKMFARLPGIEYLKRIHGATERLIRHRPMLLLCLFLAVVLQFMVVGAGVLCARALHMDFSGDKAWDYFAYIGCGHMVAAIPISLMGIGTMEIAYKQFFLGEYGTLPQLLCLAIWVRVLQLIWSLPGALFTSVSQYRQQEKELEDELGE